MNKEEMVKVVTEEIKGLSRQFEDDDYQNAVDDAERETGWSLPETNTTKLRWLKERIKRHLFFMLWTESAHKFKFKQYNLQHRFQHYGQLIKTMDEKFGLFIEQEVLLLEGVGGFGAKIDAGFQSDEYGRDSSYQEENLVIVTPTESDT